MNTEAEQLAGRALGYARCGWPVFPCQPGGKVPATRHGFRDATTDPDQIRYWWQRQPDANVAIATGTPGPDVLDIDQHGPAGNGFTACRQLRTAGLLDGARAIIATPGGGLHLYFAGSGQASGRLPGEHLDFRAAGGYVLAPPSKVGGKRYRLLHRQARQGGLDWAAVTTVLGHRQPRTARPRPVTPADAGRLVAWVERLEPGNRNCGLFWAACRAAENGDHALLGELAEAAARTGLPDREISLTIASAVRRS
jgi:hypothetical protein